MCVKSWKYFAFGEIWSDFLKSDFDRTYTNHFNLVGNPQYCYSLKKYLFRSRINCQTWLSGKKFLLWPYLIYQPYYPKHWSKSILWSGNFSWLDLTSCSVTFLGATLRLWNLANICIIISRFITLMHCHKLPCNCCPLAFITRQVIFFLDAQAFLASTHPCL